MHRLRKISADFTYVGDGQLLTGQTVVADQAGKVHAVVDSETIDSSDQLRLEGVLVPGFVNVHCHLELSHMHGLLPAGTGLVPFIQGVVSRRQAAMELIEQAIAAADKAMYDQGIVAVGDISNTADTLATKLRSRMAYYTFVEMFDFWHPDQAQHYFDSYQTIYDRLAEVDPHSISVVPHAPYSVSPSLFALIGQFNQGEIRSISMHNQETPAEQEMFLTGGGELVNFFTSMGFDLSHFRPTGKPSLYYALEHMDALHRHLMVHNTLTTDADRAAAESVLPHVYWVSCPNANLYIENRLPDYEVLAGGRAKVCLGTDSLASNWQLSIFEEMKTIARYQPSVGLGNLIRWGTQNGAEALGMEHKLGRIDVGLRPGLNLIKLNAMGMIDQGSTCIKLA